MQLKKLNSVKKLIGLLKITSLSLFSFYNDIFLYDRLRFQYRTLIFSAEVRLYGNAKLDCHCQDNKKYHSAVTKLKHHQTALLNRAERKEFCCWGPRMALSWPPPIWRPCDYRPSWRPGRQSRRPACCSRPARPPALGSAGYCRSAVARRAQE